VWKLSSGEEIVNSTAGSQASKQARGTWRCINARSVLVRLSFDAQESHGKGGKEKGCDVVALFTMRDNNVVDSSVEKDDSFLHGVFTSGTKLRGFLYERDGNSAALKGQRLRFRRHIVEL